MSYFNLFAAQNQWRPQSKTVVPMPMTGNYSQTTNVTIKNGPQGFWGFMGGLFGGLSGNIGMPMGGSIFGGMPMTLPMPMGGSLFGGFGMPGMMGMPSFGGTTGIGGGALGMLNTPQGMGQLSVSQQTANLKELYKDFGYTGVFSNGDGTFTIHGGDKPISKMTYEEALRHAETLKPEVKPEGTSDSDKKKAEELKTSQDKWISEHPDLKLTRQENGTAKAENGDIYEWKDGKYVKQQEQQQQVTNPDNGSTGGGSSSVQGNGNGSDGGSSSVQGNGNSTLTPSANIVSKDEISSIRGKRTSIYDTGTGRDFKHYNISTLGEINSEGYPQTIKLKADRGWNNQTMTFVGVKDGVAIYSISTGKLTDGKHQEYRLEKVGGEIKFTQREGDNGYGKANWNTDG